MPGRIVNNEENNPIKDQVKWCTRNLVIKIETIEKLKISLFL